MGQQQSPWRTGGVMWRDEKQTQSWRHGEGGSLAASDHGGFTIIPGSELVPPTGLNQTNMPGCPQPPKPKTWWVAAFCEVQSGVSN